MAAWNAARLSERSRLGLTSEVEDCRTRPRSDQRSDRNVDGRGADETFDARNRVRGQTEREWGK